MSLPQLASFCQSAKPFQSEPAMAYHVLRGGASCLPLDLDHREMFCLLPGRHAFAWGLDPGPGVGAGTRVV